MTRVRILATRLKCLWSARESTPSIRNDTIPDDIESQAEIAFSNIKKILEASGFGLEDVVFMKSFLTRRADRDGYQKVRSAMWGDIKPASTFLLVSGLARPEFLVEVEVVAAKSD